LIGAQCGLFKLGLEFFLANGAAGMRQSAGSPLGSRSFST